MLQLLIVFIKRAQGAGEQDSIIMLAKVLVIRSVENFEAIIRQMEAANECGMQQQSIKFCL